MYKAGKHWAFAGMMTLALLGSDIAAGVNYVSADNNEKTTQATDNQKANTVVGSSAHNFGTDQGTPNIDWSNWQQNGSFDFSQDSNIDKLTTTGAEETATFSGYHAGDTIGRSYIQAISIGVQDSNKQPILLTDLGIKSEADIKGATITFPNGNVESVTPGYYMDATTARTTDFSKACYIGYYIHQDQRTSIFEGNKGIDEGYNDQADLSKSPATYRLNVNWNAPEIDRLRQNVVWQNVSTIQATSFPNVVKEYYVDADTGEQIADMKTLGKNQRINDNVSLTPDDIQGYQLEKTIGYDNGIGDSVTSRVLSNNESLTLTPSYETSVIHWYKKSAEQNQHKVTVNYIDDDENGKLLQSVSSTGITGSVDMDVDMYMDSISQYINQGYALVSNNLPAMIHFSDHDLTFEIHFKHNHTNVDPKHPAKGGDHIPGGSANYPDDVNNIQHHSKRTIHYVDQSGKTVAPDKVQDVDWSRALSIDVVTGKVVEDNWTSTNPYYDAVISPSVANMTPDTALVNSEKTTENSNDEEITVVYSANNTPVNPNTPSNGGDNTPSDNGGNTPANNGGGSTPATNGGSDNNNNHSNTAGENQNNNGSSKAEKSLKMADTNKASLPMTEKQVQAVSASAMAFASAGLLATGVWLLKKSSK
ncbi:KxYKxGKxW signal peptide containing protein [Fructobacillus durionis]|uniref:KxYKxGKxW signal peptide containing protein n=2 Tax=Fructobacillus durionis TaxID=283737 RepID=A0A1I1FJX6_9LACO|nr:KxYKxGKxW signal peptide containing protein [Fructobacillus durionis]